MWLERQATSIYNRQVRKGDGSTLCVNVVMGLTNLEPVVVLPPAAYETTELKNLITAAGGREDDPVYTRIIGCNRAWDAASTGTDRTSESVVHTLRGDNLVMRAHNITDPSRVTYLRPIGAGVSAPSEEEGILIYSGNGLCQLLSNDPAIVFPNKNFFSFEGNPRNALLAIIGKVVKPPVLKLAPDAAAPAKRAGPALRM